MRDLAYYDRLAWEIRIERDLRADGSVYYIARHPEFGTIAGPLGTGSSPEEALADLHEARRNLIALLLEGGDAIPEPTPVETKANA
ncbi:MAG: type II toxin-antitoxin system HicB family antitoxin [Gammaproteobacteria bacterium]